mgnify:CR=1 FL=1
MIPVLRRFLAYLVACAVGLATGWWVLTMTAGRFFAPDLSAGAELVVMLGFLAPLAGLAVIQLVMGLSEERQWRGWRFWLIAPPLVYGTIARAVAAGDTGRLDLGQRLGLGLATMFVLGWVLLCLSARNPDPSR